jgi:hypothetical protein
MDDVSFQDGDQGGDVSGRGAAWGAPFTIFRYQIFTRSASPRYILSPASTPKAW